MTAKADIAFTAALSHAKKTLEMAALLDPCQDRGFVIKSAAETVRQLLFLEENARKKEAAK